MRLITGYSLFFAIGLIRADTSNEVTATSNAPPSFRYKTDQVGFFVQEDGSPNQNITSYVSSTLNSSQSPLSHSLLPRLV